MKAFTDLLKNNPVTTNVTLGVAAATGVIAGVVVVANKRKAELKATEAGKKASEAKQVFISEVTRLADKGLNVATSVVDEIKSDVTLVADEAAKKVAAARPAKFPNEAELAAKNEVLKDFYEDLQEVVERRVTEYSPLLGYTDKGEAVIIDGTDASGGEGITIIGRPGRGKSFATTEAIQNALNDPDAEIVVGEIRDVEAKPAAKKPVAKKPAAPRAKKVAPAVGDGTKPVVKRTPAPRKPAAKKPPVVKPETPEISDDADKA